MKKLLVCVSLILLFSFVETNAQTRKSVGAAEVNGTFRSYFSGKFKGSYNEVKILALGGGKLSVAFDLTYPFVDSTGGLTTNVGTADGTATIEGNTAIFSPGETGQCKITIKFVRRGTIEVIQSGTDSACGFGFNVNADGTYKKITSVKPKF